MKKLKFKILAYLLIFSTLFVSCTKENKNNFTIEAIDDTTIPIDDNQAFNMNNFVISFEQLATPINRWMYNYRHEILAGKVVETKQNIKVYGDFGNDYIITSHNFDTNGVIISSKIVSEIGVDNSNLFFEYEYDLEGFIIKLTTKTKEDVKDVILLEYNDIHQLVKKTHVNRKIKWVEIFEYNSKGKVAFYNSFEPGRYNYITNFIFSDDYMIKKNQIIENITYTTNYYYSNNLLSKVSYSDGNYDSFEYNSEKRTVSIFNRYDLIEIKVEYSLEFKLIKSWEYFYREYSFKYCLAKTNSDYSMKEYFEGTPENLDLVGYALVDKYDTSKDNKVIKESVYDNLGTKLYYVDYDLKYYGENWYVFQKFWYLNDGTAIRENIISEEWVFKLIK